LPQTPQRKDVRQVLEVPGTQEVNLVDTCKREMGRVFTTSSRHDVLLKIHIDEALYFRRSLEYGKLFEEFAPFLRFRGIALADLLYHDFRHEYGVTRLVPLPPRPRDLLPGKRNDVARGFRQQVAGYGRFHV